MNQKKPSEAIARLFELGVSLRLEDLAAVELLQIADTAISKDDADIIANMVPRTVVLNGSLMTDRDIPVLLHFHSLQGVVAHRIDFAASLLAQMKSLSCLRSIAMSYTRLTDDDIRLLENHQRIASVHFAGTKLTDRSLETFATLPALELLDMRETLVSDAGLFRLQGLSNLLTIDVRGTAVTLAGAGHYRRTVASLLPDLEILI